MLGTQVAAFMKDILATLPTGRARDSWTISKTTAWMQHWLEPREIIISRKTSRRLLFPEDLGSTIREPGSLKTLGQTGLNLTDEGMRMVGVPVGTPSYQRKWAFVKGDESTDLPSYSFQILRLFTATKVLLLLRTILLLPIFKHTGDEFYFLME